MKKFLLLSIAFCFAALIHAQKVYFIYIQSETGAPFYVRMGDKVNSSTAEGYLIIPRLKDSTYSFALGQPGKQGEFQFLISINKTDRGFLIKNTGNTVSLFDLQNLSIYKPASAPSSSSIQTTIRMDNFSKLLARAADDTSLLTEVVFIEPGTPKKKEVAEPVVVKEEVKPKQDTTIISETVAKTTEPKKLDSSSVTFSAVVPNPGDTAKVVTLTTSKDTASVVAAILKDTMAQNQSKASEPIVSAVKEEDSTITAGFGEQFGKSTIVKKSESSTSDGFGLVFFDSYDGRVDTIQLTIPNPLFFIDTTQKQAEAKEFLEITNQTSSLAKASEELKKTGASGERKKFSCAKQATDDDFFKLRRDMASKKKDDDMIDQARRYFKGKCFRSEQIKYLSTLFLTDNGKYNFFDAAYIHVSDKEKFAGLQDELKDAYYLNRFKALVAN